MKTTLNKEEIKKRKKDSETCICRLEGSSWLGGVDISSSSMVKNANCLTVDTF